MKKDSRLNQRQINILEDTFQRLLLKETMEEIAKSHGISRKTLSLWKNSDHGKQLHFAFQRKHSENFLQTFYDIVHEKMQTSFKDRELFAKMHGLLAPSKQEIVTEEKRDIVRDGVSLDEMEELRELLGDCDISKKEEKRSQKQIELEEHSQQMLKHYYSYRQTH